MKARRQLINITINNKRQRVEAGEKLLSIFNQLKIKVPTFCYHSDLPVHATCRLCVVEILGSSRLAPSCATAVQAGMKILTHSPKVIRARRLILEYIMGEHYEQCETCYYQGECRLWQYLREYRADPDRFSERKQRRPVYSLADTVYYDTKKCIECRNCIDVCQKQGIGFVTIERKGYRTIIKPHKNPKNDCIYCGQCINHCPVGAIFERQEIKQVQAALADPKKYVVGDIAPSVRVSLGEEFGLPPGKIVTGQIVAALRRLGFEKVFDVNNGADFTTYEEAQELAKRIKAGGPFPLFTTCCPAWFKYVEQKYPEFIPYCTTAKSPMMMSGTIIKEYFARKNKIPHNQMVVVSIMPCTAKKFEIKRPELRVNGRPVVDYVLTTRELALLLKAQALDLRQMPEEDFDNPLGESTGAAAIYGVSGGVMESALRSAYYFITKKNLPSVDFKSLRGSIAGVKKATVKMRGLELKLAVVNGLGNAGIILEELKRDPQAYHYVEVMTCPGGCIAGGGQPIPINDEIRAKRAQALYQIDANKKIRLAHRNPSLLRIYKEFFGQHPELKHKLLHTHYSPRQTGEVETIICADQPKKCPYYRKVRLGC